MEQKLTKWSIKKLYELGGKIQFPDYQREPNVWTDSKREKLLDSIIKKIPIPLILLYNPPESEIFECVDGQQRIQSIQSFFKDDLVVDGYGTVSEMREKDSHLIEAILSYEVPIVIIKEVNDEELREIFRRLQLGTPLNPGEKLKSLTGDMKQFIFETAVKDPFIQKIGIPERRYAKEQVLSQICINSFSISENGTYQSARYENLVDFYDKYKKMDEEAWVETNQIKETLKLLDDTFAEESARLTNRALVLSAYLFLENLIRENRAGEAKLFSEFYLKFIDVLNEQIKKGLDFDREYYDVLRFQGYITQAAFEPYQIRNRNEVISEFYEYYKETAEIKKSG